MSSQVDRKEQEAIEKASKPSDHASERVPEENEGSDSSDPDEECKGDPDSSDQSENEKSKEPAKEPTS